MPYFITQKELRVKLQHRHDSYKKEYDKASEIFHRQGETFQATALDAMDHAHAMASAIYAFALELGIQLENTHE